MHLKTVKLVNSVVLLPQLKKLSGKTKMWNTLSKAMEKKKSFTWDKVHAIFLF